VAKPSRSDREHELNQVLQTLDQLEELLEDMDELGVNSRAEAEARMRELNGRADELEGQLSSE
jgi:hypothetical protein